MGRDKLALEVGGETLIQHVANALSRRCDEVILAGRVNEVLRNVRGVEDARPGEGPLAGLEAGLREARFPLVFAAAGDLPFLSPELISYLLDELVGRGVQAVVPRRGGRLHPLCAAYQRSILPHVVSALDEGVRSVGEFVGRLGRVAYVEEAEILPFGDPDMLLMNVNTPGDLRRARELAGG
ncbi:NTP transferase domain-containing protein [Rubrobacter tropicus]|uniref:NTP transferase domain-containing protein n=2 Tax=Rubrobacter tropicus TaxID=2653851 RepID=A0A6G8Q930_9ACTN|nr:NTP transferase domain-containing protein [Rubrobacter tropicus]